MDGFAGTFLKVSGFCFSIITFSDVSSTELLFNASSSFRIVKRVSFVLVNLLQKDTLGLEIVDRCFLISLAADFACSMPISVKGGSIHPQKRFLELSVDCPCLSRISSMIWSSMFNVVFFWSLPFCFLVPIFRFWFKI